VVRVEGTNFGLALTVDCNARLVALDPYEGAKAAVAEAARNIACTGAVPLGVTDCLNFGNPERTDVFFQFQEACRGIGDACRAFDTPVTGGNVSFYNESPLGAIDPTPTIGMVGLLERVPDAVGSHFRSPGDHIIVLGETTGDMGGSAYWAEVHAFMGGRPALVDLDAERALQQLLIALARDMLVSSAHDCSDGGLAVTLAESAVADAYAPPGFGARIDLTPLAEGLSIEQILYGENGGRAVVSCHAANEAKVLRLASDHGVLATPVGAVEDPGQRLVICVEEAALSWDVARLRTLYFGALPGRMGLAGRDSRRDA
jgi:phosphoribosylformylglycinamidine synthase